MTAEISSMCKRCPAYTVASYNVEAYPRYIDEYAGMIDELNAQITSREVISDLIGAEDGQSANFAKRMEDIEATRTTYVVDYLLSEKIIEKAENGKCNGLKFPQSSNDKVYDLCGATDKEVSSEHFSDELDYVVHNTKIYPVMKMLYGYLKFRKK